VPELTPNQIADLQKRYADLINYESGDPLTPIDSLNYREPGGDGLLHIAALDSDDETVALLLDAGIDPNVQGDMGYTPLHYAANSLRRR
jgi:ankyrin repeat protein